MWTVVVGAGSAGDALAAGASVVVVVARGDPVDLPALRRAGPGRVAVYVGDPDDPATVAGAGEMAAELGGRPTAEYPGRPWSPPS